METASPSLLEKRIVGGVVRSLWFRGRTGGRREVPPHLAHERIEFEGNMGARLAGLWFPAENPRGAVVLVHPDRRLAKHWFVKSGWVDFLHENGYDVLTFDLAVYGESRGKATYFHDDVLAAIDVAKRWSGGLPVHVVGQSIGSFAAANASPRMDGVHGLVLESPYPTLGDWYGGGLGAWSMRAFAFLWPRTARAIDAGKNIAHARAERILVVAAGNDEVTRPELTRTFATMAPAERTTLLVVPEARHFEPFEKSKEYRDAILRTLG